MLKCVLGGTEQKGIQNCGNQNLDDILGDLQAHLKDAFDGPFCHTYIVEAQDAYDVGNIHKCPSTKVFYECSDAIAQAALEELPICQNAASEAYCESASKQHVDQLFSEDDWPAELAFEHFCRKSMNNMVVAKATQRTMQAWCMGESNISAVNWAVDYSDADSSSNGTTTWWQVCIVLFGCCVIIAVVYVAIKSTSSGSQFSSGRILAMQSGYQQVPVGNEQLDNRNELYKAMLQGYNNEV